METELSNKYQIMPDLGIDEYEELKEDIVARGVMVPIESDEQGNILDGHHRLRICQELGITNYPKVIRAGMNDSEKRLHARKLNLARRHMTQEQRRELIREQLAETPKKSDRQIAAELGVDNKTVGTQRKVMETAEEIPQLDTSVGADGKEYPRQVQRSNGTSSDAEGSSKILENKPHIAFNSGNNEWYTPKEYIDAARSVMGGIDLDPASNEIANRIVQANTYYSVENDGLSQPWAGRIWMNPPYAGELIPRFCEKLLTHTLNGEIKQAIILVNNATETTWFNTLIDIASAIVFPRSRVKFYTPDGKTGAPLQGQAVIYVGDDTSRFLSIFNGFGWGTRLCVE